jgi:hypothetical protein
VRRNDRLQAHCSRQHEHDEKYHCEFPGHNASGDEKTPRDTVSLYIGMSSSSRYGPVPYRYTPTRPALSPGFRSATRDRWFTARSG